jgi:hypothetical protein
MKQRCPITGEPKCKCDKDGNTPYLFPRERDTLRKLFTDHAVFTERFIVTFLDDRPEMEVVKARLLENQPEIGTYLGLYIGKENGNLVGKLLTEHIKGAAGVVDALKKGENLDKSLQIVFDNVEKVAKILSSLSNKLLKYDQVYDEFAHHNKLVVELAKLHKAKDFKKEIETYDAYYTHMLSFSDMLCDGLIH